MNLIKYFQRMKPNKKKKKSYEKCILVLSFIVVVLAIVLCVILPSKFSYSAYYDSFDLSTEVTARIGDSIGGMTAPIVGIGCAILTFFSFWIQYNFNKIQYNSIERERFENNLYEMLSIHESIVNSLKLEIPSAENPTIPLKTYEGRDIFKALYEIYPINKSENINEISSSELYKGLKELFSNDKNLKIYEKYEYSEVVGILDHYFRQLYHILKMICKNDNLEKGEKYYYASIVRSTLSQYELILLYYNCLSAKGVEKFKPLIEEFTLFNNIRPELLANENEINKIRQYFQNNDCKDEISEDEYDISAFIHKEEKENND